jgi:hypothetical protein
MVFLVQFNELTSTSLTATWAGTDSGLRRNIIINIARPGWFFRTCGLWLRNIAGSVLISIPRLCLRNIARSGWLLDIAGKILASIGIRRIINIALRYLFTTPDYIRTLVRAASAAAVTG